ncbi:MAG: hypothetical protein GX251_02900 [Firmicutes bacterium]|nr:hypothetical protein [Bacillota bacterium]
MKITRSAAAAALIVDAVSGKYFWINWGCGRFLDLTTRLGQDFVDILSVS